MRATICCPTRRRCAPTTPTRRCSRPTAPRSRPITPPVAARRGDAEAAAESVNGTQVVLIRQSSNSGQLYGSVSVRDIVEALQAEGISVVTKAMIVLERPIKTLGVFDVKVSLHPEVAVTIQVNVARSPEEADLQKAGVDVMASMFEKDEAGFTEDYDPNAEPGEIAVEMASEAATDTGEEEAEA